MLQRYLRLIAELQERHDRGERFPGLAQPQDELRIDEAIDRDIFFLENDPEGYAFPDATLGPQYAKTIRSLQALPSLYGDTFTQEFTVRGLKSCRKAMLTATPAPFSRPRL